MVEMIIIIVLGIILIGLLGLVLYTLHLEKLELLQSISILQNQKEERELQEKKRQEYNNFKPYIICTLKDEPIYNEKGKEVGKLPLNTFHTIIFEEGGRGQLFSGEGWIELGDVVKNPVRDMNIPMKVVENSPLKNGPGLGYKTIDEVRANEVVEVIDMFGIWYKIRLSNNIEGYVYHKNLR